MSMESIKDMSEEGNEGNEGYERYERRKRFLEMYSAIQTLKNLVSTIEDSLLDQEKNITMPMPMSMPISVKGQGLQEIQKIQETEFMFSTLKDMIGECSLIMERLRDSIIED